MNKRTKERRGGKKLNGRKERRKERAIEGEY